MAGMGLTSGLVRDFWENGFVIVPGVLGRAELARAPLVIRSRQPVIPFLHAQTMVVLEKIHL